MGCHTARAVTGVLARAWALRKLEMDTTQTQIPDMAQLGCPGALEHVYLSTTSTGVPHTPLIV